MKYEKNQYSEGFSICSLIFAGIFLYLGIKNIIEGWDSIVGGLILFGIGIAILSSQFIALSNRKKIRNIVKSEFLKNPNATIEDIVKATGISKKDVKAVILDLKASGELIGKFSEKTGELMTFSLNKEKDGRYCSNCGTIIENKGADYCAYCGSKLD
ncbi:MAG: hypothetical protein ACP6IY_14495 [Promethearchaeia archaeon]